MENIIKIDENSLQEIKKIIIKKDDIQMQLHVIETGINELIKQKENLLNLLSYFN